MVLIVKETMVSTNYLVLMDHVKRWIVSYAEIPSQRFQYCRCKFQSMWLKHTDIRIARGRRRKVKEVRKPFVEIFSEFEETLLSKGKAYLFHQYECKNDIHHWPIIKINGLGYTFIWITQKTSQPPLSSKPRMHTSPPNRCPCIALWFTTKIQKIHIMHTTLAAIIMTVFLQSKSYLIFWKNTVDFLTSVIRFKSDNCVSQYCCQYMFPFYADLAKKTGKPVLVYYGVNGHGRGLVDAMSGFGVKYIVRRAIITDGFYYESDEQLCAFLKTQKLLPKYYYTVLPSQVLDEDRLNYRKCTLKCWMISFSPSGNIEMMSYV